jgi:hypothetical protein
VAVLESDWERLVTFYDYQVANATALIWRVLMIAEHRFRRLNPPELLHAMAPPCGSHCEPTMACSFHQSVPTT